jgi:hypothetical protein
MEYPMLQVKLPYAATLIIAVATLAACSAEPVAPRLESTATASTLSRPASANAAAANSRQIDRSVWVSCANGGAGEAIHVTGDLRYDVHQTQDATGVIHLNIKSNTSGLTGVGTTSGTSFRGMMAEHITSRALDYLNEDVRTSDMIRFVAPGSGAAYALMVTSHFIVDQGDYVLWDEAWNEVCR